MVINWYAITLVTVLCIVVASIAYVAGYASGEYNGWCKGRREINCRTERGVSMWRRDRMRGIRK